MNGPNFRLDGKVALVTGAGRGIGLGIVRALAAAGAAVVIQDIELPVAEAEAKRIDAEGGRAIGMGGDICDLSLPKKLIHDVVEKLGGLHILINNASIQSRQPWMEATIDGMERELRADVISPILFSQEAARVFIPQKFGRIINIGSVQQRNGNPEMIAYSLSKTAMVNLTKATARDLAKHQITVNLIAPGWVNTFRNREDFPTEEKKIESGKHLPLGRVGEPEDYGGPAVFLASDAAAYMTGQIIYVDGGISAR
jgi:gluconate 5-dehydrogenase